MDREPIHEKEGFLMDDYRSSFETFKSNVCHRVKDIGDLPFIAETLKSNYIIEYFNKSWYAESLYLLAMVDYLSRQNHVPLCTNYDKIRACKLERVLYPSSVLMTLSVTHDERILDECMENAIPEFMQFNIVESEIRNVI